MSTLTSLLVRDQIVSIRAIEEAIQRQVISGGDLPSVLLEMGAVSENTLVSYVAAQYGLAPAGREEVMSIPGAILDNVSAELAIEKRILPIGEEGGRLILASARPLRGDERQELGFAIGHSIEIRITLDLRIAAGLHRHYGEALSRREQRLLRKIDAAAPGELRTVAPLDPNRVLSRDSRDEEEREAGEIRPLAPTRFSHEGKASVRADASPGDANLNARAERARRLESEPPRAGSHSAGRPSNPALRAQALEPISAPRPTSSQIERHRGPLMAKQAVEMLSKAETRDEILAISMAFIRQFFDYTALFVIHDDEAEGLDAYGSGPDYRAIQKLSIALLPTNAFGKAREERLPRVVRLGRDESEKEFIKKAGRSHAQPALVAPIAIEHRVILMLYADREGEDLAIPDIPEVIAFLPRIGDALKQLILKRKRKTIRREESAMGDATTQSAPAGGGGMASMGARSETIAGETLTRDPSRSASHETLRSGASTMQTSDVGAAEGGRRKPHFAVPLEIPKSPGRERLKTLELLGIAREEPGLPDFASLLESRGKGAPHRTEGESEAASSQERGAVNEQPTRERIETPRSIPAQPEPLPVQPSRSEESHFKPRTSASVNPPPLRPSSAARSTPASATSPAARTPASSQSGASASPSGSASSIQPPPLRRSRFADRPLPKVHKGRAEDVEIIDTASIPRTPGSPPSVPPPPLPRRTKPSEAVIGRIRSSEFPRPETASNPGLQLPSSPAKDEPRGGADPDLMTPHPKRPSIVVEDDGSVEAKVEALVALRPNEATELIDELVAAGAERALKPLLRAFPGEVFFLRSVGPLPRAAEISSVARAIAAFGPDAENAIVTLLRNGSADIRYYALAIAKEAMTPKVAQALTALLDDPDRELRRQTLEILRAPEHAKATRISTQRSLLEEAATPAFDCERRARALRDLGALGAIESAAEIVPYLEAEDELLRTSARAALITIFADDMGPSQEAWLTLIRARGDRHRIEYLIDGLLNEEESIRREAGAELQRLSREYLGYHAGLPRREREVLKKRYEEWWEARGRAIFLGARNP